MDTKQTTYIFAAMSAFAMIVVCFLAYNHILPSDVIYVLIAGLIGHAVGTGATAIQFPAPTPPASTPPTPNAVVPAPAPAPLWSRTPQVQISADQLAEYQKQAVAAQQTIQTPAVMPQQQQVQQPQQVVYPNFQQQQRPA